MLVRRAILTTTLTAILPLSGCSTLSAVEEAPWGPEFGLVTELSPQFTEFADGNYYEKSRFKDGENYTIAHGNLTYKCKGRDQEYFEFVVGDQSNPPGIISNAKPSNLRRFDPETFPDEMARLFSDRSTASDQDAIKSLRLFESDDWPPLGLADYISYEDGWLIAYDIGEFGGALIWLPKIGDSYFVSNNNTEDLYRVGEVVYAAEGLDHLSIADGGIRALRRDQHNYRRIDPETNETVDEPAIRWQGFREFYTAASDVRKVAARDGMIVGLTSHGLIVVSPEKIVQYNWPNYKNSVNAVQRAQDLFIDGDGVVYVAGVDMLGVYDVTKRGLVPDLYARKDCQFEYGAKPINP